MVMGKEEGAWCGAFIFFFLGGVSMSPPPPLSLSLSLSPSLARLLAQKSSPSCRLLTMHPCLCDSVVSVGKWCGERRQKEIERRAGQEGQQPCQVSMEGQRILWPSMYLCMCVCVCVCVLCGAARLCGVL